MSGGYLSRLCIDAAGERLPYRLLVPPGYCPSRRYPVILFLHGSGECGTDNEAQLRNVGSRFLEPDFAANWPAFVIFPQAPSEQNDWSQMAWDAPTSAMSAQPTRALACALELLAALSGEFNLDSDRQYVAGLSMGGFGAWEAITREPGRFAAAVICCAGSDERTVTHAVASVPVWIFHSADDDVVKVARARNMVAAMEAQGGEPRYTEYGNGGHNCWDAAFAEPKIFPWLFAQRR